MKFSPVASHSHEAVSVRTEGNLIRTGTLNEMEFREPLKFGIEFLFIRNPDLLGNGRLPLQDGSFCFSSSAGYFLRSFSYGGSRSRSRTIHLSPTRPLRQKVIPSRRTSSRSRGPRQRHLRGNPRLLRRAPHRLQNRAHRFRRPSSPQKRSNRLANGFCPMDGCFAANW
jgi:hypothetical protein